METDKKIEASSGKSHKATHVTKSTRLRIKTPSSSKSHKATHVTKSTVLKIESSNLNHILLSYLTQALSMEIASVERLQSRIRQTTSRDLRAQLQRHLQETRTQESRLTELISSLGGKAARDKAHLPIMSFPESVTDFVDKNTMNANVELEGANEDAIVEYGEIIFYETLLQIAQRGEAYDVISSVTQTINEERSMAYWIIANTPNLVTQLLSDIPKPVPEGSTAA